MEDKLYFSEPALARSCLQLYSELERGLGPFFLFCFSFWQVSWIAFIFMGVAAIFGQQSVTAIAGFGLIGIGILLLVTSFTFCLATCHSGIKHLGRGVRADIRDLAAGREKEEAKDLLHVTLLLITLPVLTPPQELEATGPLSGLGFFTIERSTITAMVSTAVTYIIILVQFRMST
jgi:hypothetical protein